MAKRQRKHVKRRFNERTDLKFTDRIRVFFIKQIQAQKALFVERRSNRVTIWKVKHNNSTYEVMYDKKTNDIATVLSVENNKK